MAAYKQADRLVAIDTPLGPDALVLVSLRGREQVSRPFAFELDLVSERQDVAAKDLLGRPVSFRVTPPGGEPRHFHGHVRRLASGTEVRQEARAYRAEVVPWLWFLTLTTDSRIFQEKTALEVVETVFGDLGYSDFEVFVNRSLERRDYCVQYRETDFDFVSRLLEEEGISYWFRHEATRHVLVLSDHAGAFGRTTPYDLEFWDGTTAAPDQVTQWERAQEFRPGRFTHRDFNFETPGQDLTASARTVVDQPGTERFEVYEHPGSYHDRALGADLVNLRMEELEVPATLVRGASVCPALAPGQKFKMARHVLPAETGQVFVLTSVEHSAWDMSHVAGAGRAPGYENSFTCVPDGVKLRPPRTTPRPVVHGSVTAFVTGPKGEEVYVDKYGRVKVQFHWDREGQRDEKTTCFVRVAQSWAGAQWAAHFWPRIGQEVVVSFLEGDPDRPLVVGSVYNADTMPPYALPANRTRSGWKTRSTPKGSAENFNDIRFEDKKDAEEVYVHAERDFVRVVENDDVLKVGFDKKDPGDQTIDIFNHRTVTLAEGDDTLVVKQGDRTVKVDTGHDSLTVAKGNRSVKVETGNHDLVVSKGNRSTKVSAGSDTLEAMQKIELKVGANSIVIDQKGITVKGIMVTVEGSAKLDAKSPLTTVKGDGVLTLKGGITMIN
jgi:type VI secretion system secreted protein VgrG